MNHKAGVIVIRVLENDTLLLTQRSKSLSNHPGEVCFPGGHWQQDDVDLYQTALRELHEEVGIASSRVQLLKMLKSEITLTGYHIQPWLATIDQLHPYIINSEEVDSVFCAPMQEVCDPANYEEIIVQRKGIKIKTWRFISDDYFVWGATARIMRQLIDCSE